MSWKFENEEFGLTVRLHGEPKYNDERLTVYGYTVSQQDKQVEAGTVYVEHSGLDRQEASFIRLFGEDEAGLLSRTWHIARDGLRVPIADALCTIAGDALLRWRNYLASKAEEDEPVSM